MSSQPKAVSPLRQRMIEDMRMRKLTPQTQAAYIRAVRKFARYLNRSPDTATVEHLRNFQLYLVDHGNTAERLQFRGRYRTMTDGDLARLALYEDLMPAAREAITEELEARGLRDLSSFQKQFEDDAILAKAERLSAFTPVKARPPVQKDLARNQRLLGLTGLLIFGLVGVHKWLLGDATTWRKEESLAVWLFLGLMLTWDPMVRVVRRQASRKLAAWLVLALLQIAMPAAVLAVPGLGRLVSGYSSPLVLAILFSPAIAFAVHRA